MKNEIVNLLHLEGVLLKCGIISSEEVIKTISNKLYEASFVKEGFIIITPIRKKILPTDLLLDRGIHAPIP